MMSFLFLNKNALIDLSILEMKRHFDKPLCTHSNIFSLPVSSTVRTLRIDSSLAENT